MTRWPMIAMAFPRWRCAHCRCVVDWEDAYCEEIDGKLTAVKHLACVDE